MKNMTVYPTKQHPIAISHLKATLRWRKKLHLETTRPFTSALILQDAFRLINSLTIQRAPNGPTTSAPKTFRFLINLKGEGNQGFN